MNNGWNHTRGMDPIENSRRANFLRRTANEARTYNVRMKILAAALAALVVLTGLFYIISVLYNQSGSFTIKVSKVDMTKYGLSLSESPDMTYKTSQLNMNIDEAITNIDGATIPEDIDDFTGGVHNGLHYIAYTFYLENAGEIECSVEYTVDMSGITNGLDDAMRLKLYVDGEATVYAKAAVDGNPEPGTTPFVSPNIMMRGRLSLIQPTEVHKFTVVLWIEGNDPECIDWLIDGQMKIDMNFEIIH